MPPGELEDDLLGLSLRVHGQGSRERVIPITDSLARAIIDMAEGGGFAFPVRIDGHLRRICR